MSTTPAARPEAADLRRPSGPAQLFRVFTRTSLQGFGGVLAVVQRELVERERWYTPESFLQDWAVAQVLPGPNVCNLALMLGDRTHGWRGAAAALAGLLLLPLALALLLAGGIGGLAAHPDTQRVFSGALEGMGVVAAGLIAGTCLRLVAALRSHPLGFLPALAVVVLAWGALALAGWPLTWVVPGLGLCGALVTALVMKKGRR
ncbi:MAG: hypothetical protein RL654_2644 [Pseudomonadota bacterium]|jgi:chromate transporter